MRVSISSSHEENISEIYKTKTKELCEYLSNNGYDLNWGAASTSLMGICYREFLKNNRSIYGYTTPKYKDDLDNLKDASSQIYDTTFDLKKNIFKDADLIIILPGGLGTISEFFAYLEEIRSNDENKLLVLYNIDDFFNPLISLIDELIDKNFNKLSIYDYFKVASSIEDIKELIK